MVNVTLSLISHTNVGKTTLARTLLRRDVGEVVDRAHVTDVSEAHPLIRTDGAELTLWDTPGFGNTRRLLGRLRREKDPLGWFLHQVWDRILDRPLWCSQEAVRNIRDEADVVLYLVNAAEDPEGAAYVPLELELLAWMGRPVVLLLNQIDGPAEELVAGWRRLAEKWPVVADIISLDAFSRCWVEEDVLLRRLGDLLHDEKRAAMADLAEAWNRRNVSVFRSSCEQLGGYLARASADRAPVDSPAEVTEDWSAVRSLAEALKLPAGDRKRAMASLSGRLDDSTGRLMDALISGHGLYGSSAASIEQRVQDFQVGGGGRLGEKAAALAGAAVSGALGGLAADALAGGLTLGGGLIAGGILGAVGGSVLARGYRVIGGVEGPYVEWSPEFLDQLCRQAVLRYLAVAHFGRGRGKFEDLEYPARWSPAVDEAFAARRGDLRGIRKTADPQESANRLRELIAGVIVEVLGAAYPHARSVLAG